MFVALILMSISFVLFANNNLSSNSGLLNLWITCGKGGTVYYRIDWDTDFSGIGYVAVSAGSTSAEITADNRDLFSAKDIYLDLYILSSYGYTYSSKSFSSNSNGSGVPRFHVDRPPAEIWAISLGNLHTQQGYKGTLTVNFTPNKYTIKFNGNGNTGGSMSDQSMTYDSPSKLNKNAFTKTGYYFDCWTGSGTNTYSDEQQVQNLTNGGEFTLSARWAQEKYKINYNGNGGSSPTSDSVVYNQTITLPTSTRIGYVFTGWTYNGLPYSAGQSYTVPDFGNNNATVTFTANWRPEKYKVIYAGDAIEIDHTELEYGQSLYLPTPIGRTGYTFVHWECSEGGTYSAGQKFTPGAYGDKAEITFKGVWTPRTDYKININLLDPNGSESGTRGTFDLTLDTGQKLTGLTDQPSNTLTFEKTWTISNIVPATGMHIEYVKLSSDGGSLSPNNSTSSGPYTFTGNFEKDPAGDGKWDATITIKMAWNTYTIVYNGNGSTGGSMTNTSMTYNTAKNLTKNGFTKTGYVFLYWTDANGNKYYDEQSVNNLTATNNGTVTLYAQWQATWATQAKQPSGSGTEESPYRITTANELAWIASQNNSFSGTRFKLMNDIDLSSTTYKWLPIGSTTPFQGIFIGNGFTISGVQTTDAKHSNGKYLYSNQGLFGQTNGATIENLRITNATIYGNENAGIIVGADSASSATTVQNCIIEKSTVTANSTNGMIIGNNAGIVSCCLVKSSNATSGSLGGNSQTSCLYEINGTRSYTEPFNDNDLKAWGKVGKELLPAGYSWIAGAAGITQTDITAWINKELGN